MDLQVSHLYGVAANIPLKPKCISIWKIWRDKKFFSFISGKWNSRHLVFWSLEILTGLRDLGTGTDCVKRRY